VTAVHSHDGLFSRWVGRGAPEMRRLSFAAVVGVAVTVVLFFVVRWEMALLLGWDAGSGLVLASLWSVIRSADAAGTNELAAREDPSRRTAGIVLIVASLASIAAVAFTLASAGDETGWRQGLVIAVAALTVVVSWVVVNTVFTIRYAHLHYGPADASVDFGGQDDPDYRDFAYLAFTVGMCYQVSDTTLRNRVLRRSVLAHSLLAYVFGIVIVSTGVNIVAGLAG
jgi:uncharacterized membrane protein